MPAYNLVVLMGNLTKDWTLKYTKDGTAIGNNSIAVNRRWKSADGEDKEEVLYADICLFGKMAETADKHQKKGDPIHVSGRLSLDRWQDKETSQERQKLKVIVENFQFLSTRNGDSKSTDDDDDSPAPRKTTKSATKPTKHTRDESENDPSWDVPN